MPSPLDYKSRAERVLAFLETRPDVWTEAVRFEAYGGRQAWRTAVAEARALAKLRGYADIVNRTRRMTKHAADCQKVQKVWRTCNCQAKAWTLSEYMLVSARLSAEPEQLDLMRTA